MTHSILRWLENILAERFGHSFCLELNKDGLVTISLLGDTRSVTLSTYTENFRRSDSRLPFTSWDATAEGWHSILRSPIPAPGIASLPTPLITPGRQGMHVSYDILGLVYWMLSRQEEVGRSDLDKHGRFPATSSHAFNFGYLDRPVVDEWIHILGQVIKRVWPRVVTKQHQFSQYLSHDVDNPSMYAFKGFFQLAKNMGANLIKRSDLVSFIQAPYLKLKSVKQIDAKDPYNTFDWIMDQSERLGLVSSFYFICGKTDPNDSDYKIQDQRIRSLMRRIHNRGHQIGLHPSYGSYLKPELISKEADMLRLICKEEGIYQKEFGGRMHYLRWKQPITLNALAEAGLSYDSTLCYADMPGFRCGTCFEYPAFDPTQQKELPLRIRPLVLMESSLFDKSYLGMSGQEALGKSLSLKNNCKSVGGNFTLLWHNSSLHNERLRNIYTELIQ